MNADELRAAERKRRNDALVMDGPKRETTQHWRPADAARPERPAPAYVPPVRRNGVDLPAMEREL